MPENTRARVEAISDEVKELHPLLEIILNKLPRVKQVEYSHGTNEMGADFVLSREDDTFGDLEYVGMIAKTGKIVQNFDDIEHQIDECSLQRPFFFGGKHKVRISETWIVTTSTISKNAQEKIHEKYHNRKITFIDGGKLSVLVEEYAPAYWGSVEREVGEYLAALSTQQLELDQRFSLVKTGDTFYIEQDVYRADAPRYRRMGHYSKPDRVDIAKEVLAHPALLVEGGWVPGSRSSFVA